MSKVAKYLQGHILGEITTREDVRQSASFDHGVLTKTPEMVAYPKATGDIRKIARFAWQLAEKGHTLQIHPAGTGLSSTGASLGKGLKILLSKHMNKVLEFDAKQKLVRLQPGASVDSLQSALRLHGLALPALLGQTGTVGGAVADDVGGIFAGKYGTVRQWVAQLEVVLDNGEVIQTERISKYELSKRKGIQGRIGDIYRGIDIILEEHADYIRKMPPETVLDRSGYPGIFDVKRKGGSFDLTPLLVGSQGTLGVVSEMILKTDFVPKEYTMAALAFSSEDEAHDAIDVLRSTNPGFLEYYDGSLFAKALEQGKTYAWLGDSKKVAAVTVIGFDDFSEKSRERKLKKVLKSLEKMKCASVTNLKSEETLQLQALLDIVNYTALPTDQGDLFGSELISNFYIPPVSFSEFTRELKALSESLHTELPLYGSPLSNVYAIRPQLSMKKVSDKQKIFKIIDRVNALIMQLRGELVAAGGEGRLLSRFARANWDDEYTQIVEKIKNVFDPHGIFNPEVKSTVELKELVAELRKDNSIGM